VRKLIFLATAILATGGVVLWQLSPAGSSTTGDPTLHFIAHQISLSSLAGVQFGPSRTPAQGDGFVFNESLTTPTGAPAGHDGVVCILTSGIDASGAGEAECTATAVLPGGQLVVSGIINTGSQKFELAVIGGSGIYRNARGRVVGTDLDETTTDLVVNLNLS
jgi:Dirigent-like protein